VSQTKMRCQSMSNMFSANKSFQTSPWRSMHDLECRADMPSQEDDSTLAVYYNEAMPKPRACEHELPPPQPYHLLSHSRSRASMRLQREPAKRSLPTVVVSLVKPHKILSTSKSMCDVLGFGAEEVMGRSLNLLHGPKTDVRAVMGAIKNTETLSTANFSTIIYTRDGSELSIAASCVPYFGEGGVLAGCKLQLLPEDYVFMDPALCLEEARMQEAERTKRACYRSRYNFRTGLMIQQALLHHAKMNPSAGDAADVLLA
jgi:PAS domain S-box-containing protein